MPWLLALVFFVSGATALVYEVAWVRMLANSLGASSYTVGTVLAAFMGGLALGARWIGRRADSGRRPLATYAKLEAGVAVSAALMPLAFAALPALSRAVYPAFEGHLTLLTLVRCLFAFACLVVPTALMGATFPAMASAVSVEGKRGWRVGLIYGANTLGAVGGVLVAGFFLIGRFGLRNTTWIAAGVNLLVAAVAWWIAQSQPKTEPARTLEAGPEEEEAPAAERNLALYAAAAAGFVSLGFEVLWTRMFSVLFASITYSFSLMLATFLFGLAVGAPVSGRIADGRRGKVEFIGVLQLLVAVAALGTYLAFPFLKTTTGTTSLAFGGPRWGEYLRSLAGDAALVMLVPALLMGGILPAAARIVAQGPRAGLAGRLARIYTWNTIGSMAGSLAVGFVLIPAFGNFSHVSLLLALLAAGSGILLVFRGGRWQPANRWTVAATAAVCLALVASQAPFGKRVLLEKAVLNRVDVVRIWYEEGPSLTVAVVEEPSTKDRAMYTDAFRVAGTGESFEYMRMLAHLPMLLRPDAKTACVVGLGTGTTAGTLSLWPLERIDIAELCPEVARAAVYFERANRGLMDQVGRDGRVNIYFDDGKAYLRSTRRSYDLIVAEPLNPHMSGAASLYCHEFYEAARARLTPDGIVTQWIPLQGVKSEDFRALFHTFTQVFPETAVWYFKEAILLTGHAGKFAIRFPELNAAIQRPQVQAELIPIELDDVYTLLGSFICGPKAVSNYARYADTITDDRPTIEYFRPGRPVAFVERENLDGLSQHREQILGYMEFPGALEAQRVVFRIISTNHYMARGEFIQARLLEMDAERARAAGDMNIATRLYSNAMDRLKTAHDLAPMDDYVAAALRRYDAKPGAELELEMMTEARAKELIAWSKGTQQQKIAALMWLKKLEDWNSGAVVQRLLSDSDPEVRLYAADALGPIGRAETREPDRRGRTASAELLRNLLTRARETKNVKLMAIRSLTLIGAEAADDLIVVFSLKDQMGDAEPEVRIAAVAALREIATPECVGYLMLAINDSDVRVRGEAVVSLANTRDPAAVPALVEALKDSFPAVRAAAAEGLKLITNVGKDWNEAAPDSVKDFCRDAWNGWYDAHVAKRRLALRYGEMTRVELADEIEARLAARAENERTIWQRAKDHITKFSDPLQVATATMQDLDSIHMQELLRLVSDDEDLWLALVIYEQKAAILRKVSTIERRREKR